MPLPFAASVASASRASAFAKCCSSSSNDRRPRPPVAWSTRGGDGDLCRGAGGTKASECFDTGGRHGPGRRSLVRCNDHGRRRARQATDVLGSRRSVRGLRAHAGRLQPGFQVGRILHAPKPRSPCPVPGGRLCRLLHESGAGRVPHRRRHQAVTTGRSRDCRQPLSICGSARATSRSRGSGTRSAAPKESSTKPSCSAP